MQRKEKRKSLKKDQIVEQGLKLLQETGIENLSVSDVAQACGMLPSNIYYYFKSIDEIIDLVFLRVLILETQNMYSRVKKSKDGIDALYGLIDGKIEFYNSNPDYYELLYHSFLKREFSEKFWKDEVYPLASEIFTHIENMLRPYCKKNKTLRPREYANYVHCSIQGILDVYFRTDKSGGSLLFPLEEMVKQLKMQIYEIKK